MNPNASEPEDEDDIGRSAKAAALLGALFTLAALVIYGGRAATSVLVGVAIAIANLLTMRAIIRALIQGPSDTTGDATRTPESPAELNPEEPDSDVLNNSPPPSSPPQTTLEPAPNRSSSGLGGIAWGLFAGLKILFLFGGVWFLLTRNLVDPMPLVVGYGVLPLGIAASALWSSLGTRR